MADQFEWLGELDPKRLAWLHKDKLINIIQQVNSARIMEIHNKKEKEEELDKYETCLQNLVVREGIDPAIIVKAMENNYSMDSPFLKKYKASEPAIDVPSSGTPKTSKGPSSSGSHAAGSDFTGMATPGAPGSPMGGLTFDERMADAESPPPNHESQIMPTEPQIMPTEPQCSCCECVTEGEWIQWKRYDCQDVHGTFHVYPYTHSSPNGTRSQLWYFFYCRQCRLQWGGKLEGTYINADGNASTDNEETDA